MSTNDVLMDAIELLEEDRDELIESHCVCSEEGVPDLSTMEVVIAPRLERLREVITGLSLLLREDDNT